MEEKREDMLAFFEMAFDVATYFGYSMFLYVISEEDLHDFWPEYPDSYIYTIAEGEKTSELFVICCIPNGETPKTKSYMKLTSTDLKDFILGLMHLDFTKHTLYIRSQKLSGDLMDLIENYTQLEKQLKRM